jgi:hypothetical protein
MLSEIDIILNIISKYGFGGISLILLACVIFLVRKIATNHLHHIDMKLDVIGQDVKNLTITIDDMKSHCGHEGERIAKLEGKLE